MDKPDRPLEGLPVERELRQVPGLGESLNDRILCQSLATDQFDRVDPSHWTNTLRLFVVLAGKSPASFDLRR